MNKETTKYTLDLTDNQKAKLDEIREVFGLPWLKADPYDRDEAYVQGQQHQKDVEMDCAGFITQSLYDKGLEDAWKLAGQCVDMEIDRRMRLFGGAFISDVFEKSAKEAKKIVEDFDNSRIHIHDVVQIPSGDIGIALKTTDSGSVSVMLKSSIASFLVEDLTVLTEQTSLLSEMFDMNEEE